ncbi:MULTISPECIES: NUDIX hydrolase [Paenibacillus]|uniref:NUDIX hydrolase n=1 Tax=Paenibacillus TaxID=44249 RepID=UPI001914E9B8|nr:NUDIX domain-containing protein [Paenibacillus sp. EPM92]
MSKSEERFDIFDERMNLVGTASRGEVHAQGLWHQTFQCWLWYETEGEGWLLFQERHPGKDTYPGLLDISCAGHLLAGERVEDGLRELEEELGVEASFDQLHKCGMYTDEALLAPDCIDREFCHVFVLKSGRPLTAYKLQPDEVTGLYAVRFADVQALAAGKLNHLRIHGVRPDDAGELTAAHRVVSTADFVPRPEAYYRMVLDAVRVINDEK